MANPSIKKFGISSRFDSSPVFSAFCCCNCYERAYVLARLWGKEWLGDQKEWILRSRVNKTAVVTSRKSRNQKALEKERNKRLLADFRIFFSLTWNWFQPRKLCQKNKKHIWNKGEYNFLDWLKLYFCQKSIARKHSRIIAMCNNRIGKLATNFMLHYTSFLPLHTNFCCLPCLLLYRCVFSPNFFFVHDDHKFLNHTT